MPQCDNCGGWVSQDYARVFGDSERTVERCPACKRQRDHLPHAAHPDVDQEQKIGKRISSDVREANRERGATAPEGTGADGVELGLDWQTTDAQRQSDLTEWSD